MKTNTAATEKYHFLSGGGEMGMLTRAKDWSKTPLGETCDWPQSLRTMVSVMLDNPFGMYIVWGKDYIQVYNDGFRPILGQTKHPQALGISARETFSEIWDTIEPMFDGVMKGKAVAYTDFVVPLNRNGFVEDCYFDFSYSPIRLEDGEVGGILVTVIETTNKKIAEDKLKESLDQLEFAIEAAELGTFDYSPATNKFFANDRFKNWFGLPPGTEMDPHQAMNAIAEKDRQRVAEAIKKTMEFGSGFNYNIEYTIVHPVSKKETHVHARGRAWFNEEKIAYRFNGTLEDITEKTISNIKRAESEQHIRSMVLESPIGICVLDAATLVSEIANDSFIEVAGKPYEAIVGKFYWDAFAEARAFYEPALDEVVKTGIPFHADEVELMLIRNGKEEIIYVTFVYVPLKDDKGKVIKVAVWVLENTTQVITRRKIEESERNLRLMIQQAPVAIAILRGRNYVVEIVNANALELWGRKEEEVLNKPILEAMPELLTQGIKDALDNVYDTGNPFVAIESPVEILRKEKLEKLYINFSFEPLYDVDGKINGIMPVGFDVTPQVVARQRIAENEEKLNITITASKLGNWELDLLTDTIIYSDRYLEIFGVDKNSNMSHADAINKIHPDDVEKRNQAVKESFITSNLFYEARLLWPDNSIRWIIARGKVFYDDKKNPVKILGTIQDVTEEKNYENDLLKSEQKFRLLADSMPQFIWISDEKGNFNYFNQALFNYSGLTPQDITKNGWLQIVHPDEKEENIKQWTNSLTTGNDFIFEHQFRRYDGEYRWQLSRAIGQKDAQGNIQMWVGSSTDIQDMKELDQQKDYFISMASHELKTPITSINAYVQLLQMKYKGGEDTFLQNSLKVVEKQIKTLTKLIADLLDISKIKSGALHFNKEHFNITELIHEVVTEIKHIKPDYNIPVTAGGKIMVYADRDRISQVLINFLTNAIKYAVESYTIEVKSMSSNNEVIVSVQDFGIGISKKDQKRIFEKFYRVEGKNERNFKGFGIGLFIAAEIIKQHDGTINVKSEPGKGSVFSFTLPVTV